MYGHCFVYTSGENGFSSSLRVVPLEHTLEEKKLFYGRDGWTGREDKKPGHYNYGKVYAEAGFSFHFDPLTNTKYWGAPGSWNWTGTFVM